MIYGTSHFISREAAERYFSAYETDAVRAVALKLSEGSIHIGKPELKPGQSLTLNRQEGRYFIEEAEPVTEADEVAASMTADLDSIHTFSDALAHCPSADEVGYQVRDNMAEALLKRAKEHQKTAMQRLVKRVAPGFYTERDGGNWYAVAPAHYRIAEDFERRDDARRCIAWLAGEPMPDGWSIVSRNDLSCALDCGQGSEATIWTREACKAFPDRAADLKREA